MSRVFSIGAYRRTTSETTTPNVAELGELVAASQERTDKPQVTPMQELPQPKLTKAGLDFRQRFHVALAQLKAEATAEIKAADKPADVRAKITVRSVLKRAKASPLAAYSPLHRDDLLPLVEAASDEISALMAASFKRKTRSRPSAKELAAELKKARQDHAKAIAKLASQRLSEFVAKSD